MAHLGGSESLVSVIRRAQALNPHVQDERLQQRRDTGNNATDTTTTTENKTLQNDGNDIVSAASFYVPALPAASSSNLILAPMFSGHLPASYSLNAQSRDTMPDDAVSDAHLFFVRNIYNHSS